MYNNIVPAFNDFIKGTNFYLEINDLFSFCIFHIAMYEFGRNLHLQYLRQKIYEIAV